MVDPKKLGKPWSDGELDVIVADYFAMLRADFAGRKYVKAHHCAALMELIGRSRGAIEFKHENISAVLEELGMPWIPGYKPRHHYQDAIFGAIDRYISSHVEILESPASFPDIEINDDQIFIPPPPLTPPGPRPHRLVQLVRKYDPLLRDLRNQSLGRAGEAFVLDLERRRLDRNGRPDLAAAVCWVAKEEGDGAGYDILSFEATGEERRIEVKTTNGAARTPFFLTRNEYETAAAHAESWRLYRLHRFAQSPRIFIIAPPLKEAVHLDTATWRASFGT